MTVKHIEVPIEQLQLDEANPRHGVVRGQPEALAAVIADQGDKLLNLAEDVAREGLSPIEELLVVKGRGPLYTVLEGNRRTAALKLLADPAKAPDARWKRRLEKIAAEHQVPGAARCAVLPSAEAARIWQERRHTGEQEGVGVIRWSAEASARFRARPKTQSGRAIAFLDYVATVYPDDIELRDLAQLVREQRLTTLGRLVNYPPFRVTADVELRDDVIIPLSTPRAMRPVVRQVLEDLAGSVDVSDLKNERDRAEYVVGLKEAAAGSSGATSGGPTTLRRPPTARRRRAPSLFRGLRLSALGERVDGLLDEIQRLDVDAFPAVCGAMLRVLLELAVTEVYAKRGWKVQQEVAPMLKKCLANMERSSGAIPELDPVRTGLVDGTSLMAVRTLHSFVHHPTYHATPTDVRSIAMNLAPFLAKLEELV